MNSQGTDPRLMEALEGASSLQLYQLKAVIEGMLADPRRAIAARAALHLGQPVQFVDFRDGQMRRGKIIAMRDTQATVLEEGTKRTWKIPCLAMQGSTVQIVATSKLPMSHRRGLPSRKHMSASSNAETPSPSTTAMVATLRASSCASTSARPPSAPAMAKPGGCRSMCCAKCFTSETS